MRQCSGMSPDRAASSPARSRVEKLRQKQLRSIQNFDAEEASVRVEVEPHHPGRLGNGEASDGSLAGLGITKVDIRGVRLLVVRHLDTRKSLKCLSSWLGQRSGMSLDGLS